MWQHDFTFILNSRTRYCMRYKCLLLLNMLLITQFVTKLSVITSNIWYGNIKKKNHSIVISHQSFNALFYSVFCTKKTFLFLEKIHWPQLSHNFVANVVFPEKRSFEIIIFAFYLICPICWPWLVRPIINSWHATQW